MSLSDDPVRVVITGAAGQIGYALIPMIANGNMFGPNRRVSLRLLDVDIPAVMTALGGVKMELEDGDYHLVEDVVCTADPCEAFYDATHAILVGAFPRKEGMERKDVMAKNVAIFKTMGENIENFAHRNCKVLVVGNPANTNCLICSEYAPSIPKENFTALTRLDHNRAIGQVAIKAKCTVSDVSNIIIWGNHSSTQYPDVNHGTIKNKAILSQLSREKKWLDNDFIPMIQQRGAAIIKARKASSALSAANAIVGHMHDWCCGTRPNQWVSMGVITTGDHYGVAPGICYSLPCYCRNGEWVVESSLSVDAKSQKLMRETEAELVAEKAMAHSIIASSAGSSAKKGPLNVVVTGAAGQIGYALIPMIANGNMFGENQSVNLRLLDVAVPAVMTALGGVKMELEDGDYHLVGDVMCTADADEAFTNADVAILVGAFPRKEGMERKDVMAKNVAIFKTMGETMERSASKDIKVLVVGNPANTNCLICSQYAPSIPQENFTALTRLDHNRAMAQVAIKAGVSVGDVENVIIWGNHSSTQYPDVNHGCIKNKAILDACFQHQSWFTQGEFIPMIQQRGAAIIKARKASSALSAANAIVGHMRDWFLGTKGKKWVSMGVIAKSNPYGIETDICYSYPVQCSNGNYRIVSGLGIDASSRRRMKTTEEELVQEKAMAASLTGGAGAGAPAQTASGYPPSKPGATPTHDISGRWKAFGGQMDIMIRVDSGNLDIDWGPKKFRGTFVDGVTFKGSLVGMDDFVHTCKVENSGKIFIQNGQSWSKA